jgi:outer membrane protein TolC
VISARLARLLLLKPTVDLKPADPTIVPISLVPPDSGLDDLVAVAVQNRPELREGQALVGAARERWRQAQVAPLLPRLEVSYTSGLFGGGTHDELNHYGGRGDGTAAAVWELHNLGAGDVARARVGRTQFEEANLHATEIQAAIGEDVAAAAKLVRARRASLDSAQEAVTQALETWRRLREAAFGMVGSGPGRQRQYDPLEPLIAERDLDQARTRYLAEVIGYNQAQFRLYWALGQPPLCALPGETTPPVTVPVVPTAAPQSGPLAPLPTGNEPKP